MPEESFMPAGISAGRTYPRGDFMCVGAAGFFRYAMWPEDRIRIRLRFGFAGMDDRRNRNCRHMSVATVAWICGGFYQRHVRLET
jgi:hypothetical protein